MNSKRGSHVGTILSFTIFIVFIVFLYSAIEPAISVKKEKQVVLESVDMKLKEIFMENLTTIIVKAEDIIDPVKTCFIVGNLIGNVTDETSFILKNSSGSVLGYSISGNSITIETGSDFDGFLKIYYSKELGSSPSFIGGTCGTLTQISPGLIRIEEKIFNSKIIETISNSSTKYSQMKDELKIPPGTEFEFSFTYDNGSSIKTIEKNVSTNVYAKEDTIQYIEGEANIKTGTLNVRIW